MERKIGDTVNNPLMYITQPAYPPVKLKMQQSCVVKVSPRKKRELTEEVAEKVSETVQSSSTAVDISDIESHVKKNQIIEEQTIPKKDLIEENEQKVVLQKTGTSEVTENTFEEKVEVPKKNLNKIKKRTKKVLVKRGRIRLPNSIDKGKSVDDEQKEETVNNKSKLFFPPVEDQVKNNLEMVITPVEDKVKNHVESHVAPVEEKLKSNVEYHVEPAVEKVKSNVEYHVEPAVEKLKSNVEYHVEPTVEELKSNVEYHVEPTVEKLKNKVEFQVEPAVEKLKSNEEFHTAPAVEKLKGKVESHAAPAVEIMKNTIDSYAAPIEEKLIIEPQEKLDNYFATHVAPEVEKVKTHFEPVIPMVEEKFEKKLETHEAPIENKFEPKQVVPVEEKIINPSTPVVKPIEKPVKNKRKPETLKDLLKEKLPGLQDVVEGKPVHLMSPQANQTEIPETQEEENSKENEAAALKRRMISTYGIRSSFEKGKRATLKHTDRSLPIINAQKLSELRHGKQLAQNIEQAPSVTENSVDNVEQQAINLEPDQGKNKPKRFKEMSIREKVEYLVNLPVIVPKVKCEIRTKANTYQGVIAGYANGNVIIAQRKKPFRVEVKIDDILEINRKSF
ncbi:CotO family spore coat protein [Calidifontibacillus erzurumensis]|uniref:CotO family spore coat protein n=1 Tax=Calidifontibacillus erzurumensis TaxID=2741433 RepID=UPI0035B51C0E